MVWRWVRWDGGAGGRIRPLSWWWVALYAATALLIGGLVTLWAWPPQLRAPVDATKAEVEAIRTGLAAAGGAGAVFTLLLAVRRQRSTEHDAEQQRMTELYTAAVEQLGHDRVAVRLGALYALERLGQNHPGQRPSIVKVWCAYLRMSLPDPQADGLTEDERETRRQEPEVRRAVQDLLRDHVHSGPRPGRPASPGFWGDDLDVDLTGAMLHGVDLSGHRIHPRTKFTAARFTGDTDFGQAEFSEEARFTGARFVGRARFDGARFAGSARFDGTEFAQDAWFEATKFEDSAWFTDVRFGGAARFTVAAFHANAWFTDARFGGEAQFDDAEFAKRRPAFNGAVASDGQHSWPSGWTLVMPAANFPEFDHEVRGKLVQAIPPQTGAGADRSFRFG